jgi:stage III sporulation protein AD
VELLQIVGLGLVTVVIITVLKAQRPEIAVQISILAGIAIFVLIVSKLSAVIEFFNSFSSKAGIDSGYLKTLFKIIGIAYIVEFGAEICKDAGESSIASKLELAGKVAIIIIAIPIITSVFDLIINIIP